MWSQKVQVGVLAVAESAALVAVAEVSPAVVSAAAVAAAGKPHTETNSVDTFKLLTNKAKRELFNLKHISLFAFLYVKTRCYDRITCEDMAKFH